MAALSSTQSGNWTSSSTWGGSTPADGDTFTINRGHKVTVNSDVRTTNGYGDIQCYGNLHFATNGKFRLNGRITVRGQNSGTTYTDKNQFAEADTSTGGLFSCTGNNIILEVRGSNSDQHGVWVETERFASLKIDGDEKRTTTALSATASPGNTYLTVSDDTGFAIGDWIAVYRQGDLDIRVLSDEGFWVHDVDTANNRIYVRQFVSPTAQITSVSGSTVYVDNAKVFRKGYQLICDTGSNRKVATINTIDYKANRLTMSTSFVSANVGETLYQTGLEKHHPSADKVQKIATTLTTAITSANSTNQITVGSASDIAVGDEIIIDVNNDTDTNWNYDTQYTVSSKSGNTLTLNTNVRYTHKVGSVVQILTRHITFKGVDNSSDTRPFLLVERWTDGNNARTRQILLRNMRFTQWGNNTNSTYYRGVMLIGRHSNWRDDIDDGRYDFSSALQGSVIDNCNTANQAYTGFTWRDTDHFIVRNNVAYHCGDHMFWAYSSNYSQKFHNNFATRGEYTTCLFDSLYDPNTEISYNYFTRSDDYGMLMHHMREPIPVRHNILINHEQRPWYCFYFTNECVLERMYMDGFRSQPYIGEGNGTVQFLDSYMDNRWYKSMEDGTAGIVDSDEYLGYGSVSSRTNQERTSGKIQHWVSYEHNFRYDAKLESYGGAFSYMTSDSSYRNLYTVQGDNYVAFAKQVYVPANTTVRISAKMKLSATGSYTRPYLFAKPVSGYHFSQGRYRTAYTSQTGVLGSDDSAIDGTTYYGFKHNVQFSDTSDWQEQQLTCSAQPKGYILIVGIWTYSNNEQEIHQLDDIDIFFDNAPPIKRSDVVGRNVRNRNSFSATKKRIGGTRL